MAELGILLVRHAQSEANRQNVLVSSAQDPPLTPEGIQHAKKMAELWSGHAISALYTSPLRRARETATEFVANHPRLTIQIDARLHEIGLGRWDGRPISEIEQNDMERFQQWKQDPEMGAPDGGEALSAVFHRMNEFLDGVRVAYSSGLVVAVTHADCLKALVLGILHAPWAGAQWLHLANLASVYVVWRENHWQVIMMPELEIGR